MTNFTVGEILVFMAWENELHRLPSIYNEPETWEEEYDIDQEEWDLIFKEFPGESPYESITYFIGFMDQCLNYITADSRNLIKLLNS